MEEIRFSSDDLQLAHMWKNSLGNEELEDKSCQFLIQHCFICRPSDSNVSEDAEIETQDC